MIKFSKVKKLIYMSLSLIFIAVLLYGGLQIVNASEQDKKLNSISYGKSIFSWEEEPYLRKTRNDFYKVLDSLEITSVYQFFSEENLYSEDAYSFLFDMDKKNIDIYYLMGNPSWGIEETPKSMFNEIDKVERFNEKLKNNTGFKGIIIDVEPYLTEQWDIDKNWVMDTFVQGIIKSNLYAKSKGLRVIVCIPSWFDKSHYEQLEKLISKGCDEIAIMNYSREGEFKNIKNEIYLAEKYEKDISCIFEFQKPGKHGLTENETYYNLGLEKAKENFEKILNGYKYKRLNFSYHYYKPIKELLRK